MRHLLVAIVLSVSFGIPSFAQGAAAPTDALNKGLQLLIDKNYTEAETQLTTALDQATAAHDQTKEQEALYALAKLYRDGHMRPLDAKLAERLKQIEPAPVAPKRAAVSSTATGNYPPLTGRIATLLLVYCQQNFDSVAKQRIPDFAYSHDFTGTAFQIDPSTYLVSTSCAAELRSGATGQLGIIFKLKYIHNSIVVVSRDVSVNDVTVDGVSGSPSGLVADDDRAQQLRDRQRAEERAQEKAEAAREAERQRLHDQDSAAYASAEASRRAHEAAGVGTGYFYNH